MLQGSGSRMLGLEPRARPYQPLRWDARRVEGLEGVEGLGFRVWGLGLRVYGVGFRVEAFGLRVQGLTVSAGN